MSTPASGNAQAGNQPTTPAPAPVQPAPAPAQPAPAAPSIVDAVKAAVEQLKAAQAAAAARYEREAKDAALTTLRAVLAPADPSSLWLHVTKDGVVATEGKLCLLVRDGVVVVAEKHELGWREANPPVQVKQIIDLAGPLGVR